MYIYVAYISAQRKWVPSWWRYQMEAFSALLVFCAGNSPVTGEFPTQRPVTRSFDVFFDLRVNKRLSKQSLGWWFETPTSSLWRHCNADYFLDYWNDKIWSHFLCSLLCTRQPFNIAEYTCKPVMPDTPMYCVSEHRQRHSMCHNIHQCIWLMTTSSNGNILRVTSPLCEEITGHRWIPLTKSSDADLWCFLWAAPEWMVE